MAKHKKKSGKKRVMKFMLMTFLIILASTVILAFLTGVYFNFRASRNPNHALFAKGTVPSNLDGFYKGNRPGSTWQGKVFNNSEQTGINKFTEGERYVFKTYPGYGLRDEQLPVLKIDYNQKSNPWWLHFVVDELVQTGDGKYLGKVHLEVIPWFPVTVTYFELSR